MYFESLCRSSLGDHLDKLANIVTTVVVPLFLPQTPLYKKKDLSSNLVIR